MKILTIIDVTGTQDYIFGTNRLRENIGASELVALATDSWVKMFAARNVIFCGGGNAFLLFDNLDDAREFTKKFTKKLLLDAPNLEVVVKHESFDENSVEEFEIPTDKTDDFGEAITKTVSRPMILTAVENTFIALNKKKMNRQVSAPLLGLAVSAQCISTGGVTSKNPLDLAEGKGEESRKSPVETGAVDLLKKLAEGKGEESRKSLREKYKDNFVSLETYKKLEAVSTANDRLRKDFLANITFTDEVREKLGADCDRLDFPLELDNLGRSEEDTSFIAVVHTDGNGMAQRIRDYAGESKDFEDWRERMRKMSAKIEQTNRNALQKTIDFLVANLDKDENGKVVLKSTNGKSFELKTRKVPRDGEETEIVCLPFRPIIFGGDDLSFICDARIALDLTAFYLEALSESELADGKQLFARAGISIVKSHYPFSRAYALAEDLAKEAKNRIKEVNLAKEAYAMDWHVAMSGLLGNIEEIRKREYTVSQGNLNKRPLLLKNDDWRNLENFKNVIEKFQTDEKWSEKRNKIKALREALRGGSNKVKDFISSYGIGTLPEIKNRAGIENDGWKEVNICGYFDEIEMLDLYFPLKNERSKADELSN